MEYGYILNQRLVIQRLHANLCCIYQNIAILDCGIQCICFLQRMDADLAVGYHLLNFFHCFFAVCVKFIFSVEDGKLLCAIQCALHLNCGCSTACTHHGDFLTLHINTVFLQVSDKAHAVCVIAVELAILYHNGIAGTNQLCRIGKLVHQLCNSCFAGHCYVKALTAQYLQCIDCLLCFFQRHIVCQISIVQTGLCEAVVIHGGRAAMPYGGTNQTKHACSACDSFFHCIFPPLFFSFVRFPVRHSALLRLHPVPFLPSLRHR